MDANLQKMDRSKIQVKLVILLVIECVTWLQAAETNFEIKLNGVHVRILLHDALALASLQGSLRADYG